MRLQSIDSLRGVAAAAVVAYHMTGGFGQSPIWTAYGFTGVYLFFVISGFCIHLRSARGEEVAFASFWKRRVLRLYPAYLASILLYIWWANDVSAYDLVMHLLMLHNLDLHTVYSMNGVWWTLAIEEQLYLLYFLLLWARNRWGWGMVLGATFLARFLMLFVSLRLYYAGIELPFGESALSNWWIWALGAVAVEAYIGKVKLPEIAYSFTLSALIFTGASVLYYYGFLNPGSWASRGAAALASPLWGIAFFLLINRVVKDGLSLKVCTFVGVFSYSLYLTHEVVIKGLEMPWFVTFPACLLFAYAFFWLFEKPFMGKGSLLVSGRHIFFRIIRPERKRSSALTSIALHNLGLGGHPISPSPSIHLPRDGRPHLDRSPTHHGATLRNDRFAPRRGAGDHTNNLHKEAAMNTFRYPLDTSIAALRTRP